MASSIHFSGPAKYRLSNMVEFGGAVVEVCVRRASSGPLRPGWNWFMEVATEVLKRRMNTVREMNEVEEARRYLDSVEIRLPEIDEVNIAPVVNKKFKGSWFTPKKLDGEVTVLYFHGGGYSFYPKSYASFIALIALAMKSKTFALDYSLTPGRRFPTQLGEAVDAYRWLVESRSDPDNLVVAGDSAGGNLVLALLQVLRDLKFPMPALAVALSPATDFTVEPTAIACNPAWDWVEAGMLTQWADWFCDPNQRWNPLVSPIRADFHDLAPIYIQAGRAEILYESMESFADRARSGGADVVLESWEDMNHDFQMFGKYVPQSAEALRRLGEVIGTRVRERLKAKEVRH